MRQIAGLILAGGAARRMAGAQKPLLPVGGVPMLVRVIGVLRPQCDLVAISGDPRLATGHECPVIVDASPLSGPLSALIGALDWFAANHPGITHVLSAPGDTPFLPTDLGARLSAALGEKPNAFCACARSGGRMHPVAGLWPLAAREALRAAQDLRSFHAALQDRNVAFAEWPTEPVDPFFNVNTPGDLEQAQRIAG